MHPYLHPLITLLEQHQDPAQAGPMAQYMRQQFPYLGIKTPRRNELIKQFLAQHGKPRPADLEAISRDLWALPQREYQYVAIGFLEKMQRHLTPDSIPLLEYLITTKSWWDTIDSLASHSIGYLCATYPQLRQTAIQQWRSADNFWLRRTTLLFQLAYKEETDAALLFSLIRDNLNSDEFFIQKAIGWALREYSKTDDEAVIYFVANTPLAPLSQREALKWLKAQGVIT